MQVQMLTSKNGGELVSFKVNGIEKIHQGEDVFDENGKVYWKRHFPVLFPIVGKLKRNQAIINGKTYEIFQHGFARDMEYEAITKQHLQDTHLILNYIIHIGWMEMY